MPLSAGERAVVLGRITTFLEHDFPDVLSRYYALGVAYSSKHPQNINNELRNAVTHMSRALTAADMTAASREMDAVDRHVERFKRDCLKVCVIYAGRSAGELIRRAERAYGRVDPNLSLEAAALVRDRYGILIKEVLGDADAAANWAALLLRIETFRERVIQSYRLLDERKYWLPLLIARLWRWFSSAVAWVVLAILALAVGSAAIPHPEAFGEKAQAYVLRLTGAVLGMKTTVPKPGR